MTKKFSYLDDIFNFVAIIKNASEDERGYYITLDQSFFYPQGGGQPSDQGYLHLCNMDIAIVSARVVDSEIRHYVDQNCNKFIGQTVDCHIDPKKRTFLSQLHTSGHLISNILEEIHPHYKAIKGHHFPAECYVEFITENAKIEFLDLTLLNQKIASAISENLAIQTMFIAHDQISELYPKTSIDLSKNQYVRIISIGNFPFQPCGGTHVKNTSELKGLEITKYKIKNNSIKIYYEIKE